MMVNAIYEIHKYKEELGVHYFISSLSPRCGTCSVKCDNLTLTCNFLSCVLLKDN